MGAGVVLNALTNKAGVPAGLYDSLTAALIAYVFFIIPFFLGALGGGDVKLMMAIGALKGCVFLLYSIISIGLVSFVLSLFVFIMQIFKDHKFSGTLNILISFYHQNVLVGEDEFKPILKKNLKFGISIFLGTIIAYLYMLKK